MGGRDVCPMYIGRGHEQRGTLFAPEIFFSDIER